MKKFQCTAGHQSFNGPTTRKKSWYKEKRCGKYDSKKKHKKKKKRYRDIEISSESNTDESDLLNGEELMSLRSELNKKDKIIDIHTNTISDHCAEIHTLKEQNVALEGKIKHLESEGVKKALVIKNLRSEKKTIWNRLQYLMKEMKN